MSIRIAMLLVVTSFQFKSQTNLRRTYQLLDTGMTVTLTIPSGARVSSFLLETPQGKETHMVIGPGKQVEDTLELWATRIYYAPKNAVDQNKYLLRLASIDGQLKMDLGQLVPF